MANGGKGISMRTWLSVVTMILIALVLFFSRNELVHAWKLFERVDLTILWLVIPLVAISYLSAGEMVFSYLREKKFIRDISPWTLMRISLELNFVNHILPSGGVSGISYLNWRLGKYDVPVGRATIAQMIRYVVGYGGQITLLALAVLLVTVDSGVNRLIILMSSALVSIMIITTLLGVYLLKSPKRLTRFAEWISSLINRIVRTLTFGKRRSVVQKATIAKHLEDMHDDYLELSRNRRVLIKPYVWSLIFTAAEVAVFWVVFWALGSPINPAPILIAYGIATFVGFAVVTPGGAGLYEASMVLVLSLAGLNSSQAIAGIVLARVIILLTTILLGYVFYQLTLIRYGKRSTATDI